MPIKRFVSLGAFACACGGFAEKAVRPVTGEAGKSLVSKIFGSGDLTKVASTAAENTGVSGRIIGSILPIMATLLGGVLAKSAAAGDSLTDVIGQIASDGSGGLLGTFKNATQKMTG